MSKKSEYVPGKLSLRTCKVLVLKKLSADAATYIKTHQNFREMSKIYQN